MKVLVTGATGYIGRRVARRLVERGESVVGVARSQERVGALPGGVDPLVADLADTARLTAAAAAADAVIHTGFPSHGRDWALAVAVEADLIRAFAERLRGTPTRLVVSNGTAFYGDAGGCALDETTPIVRDHPGTIRATGTAPTTRTPGLDGIELRLASFVYGAAGSVFLPILVDAARRTGRALYVGEGANRLSAVHVDDAADAYLAALAHGRGGETYHVAADDRPTGRQLAEAVAIGTGAVLESVSADEAAARLDPFTAMFLALDNGLSSRKARHELGWSPLDLAGAPLGRGARLVRGSSLIRASGLGQARLPSGSQLQMTGTQV